MKKTDPRFGSPGIDPRFRRLTELLEDRYRLPGVGWRFGLDPLIGLVPVVGDLLGLVIGLAPVYEAVRLRAPTGTVLKMLLNLCLDSVLGSVPVLGDLFDFIFKANRKNLSLLREAAGLEPESASAC